ncbi:chaplin [Streptomyces halobius]|uniref:chaplin n=1 Tax=Streptomyces halobius TaxID=2879846 RepID=UPI003872EEA6
MNSPDIGASNNVQVPVSVSARACGDTTSAVGPLKPSFGSDCTNKQIFGVD